MYPEFIKEYQNPKHMQFKITKFILFIFFGITESVHVSSIGLKFVYCQTKRVVINKSI